VTARTLEVLDPGPSTAVQDLGRPGLAALGVPRSGAFDRAAAGLANRLVGNPPRAAVLEVTLGGLCLRLLQATTVAVTGATCPGLEPNAPVTLPAGAVVRLGRPAAGLRSYLAVRGGIDVPEVLGSRSTDLLSGLGPSPLGAGDTIPIGRPDPATAPSGVPAGPQRPPSPVVLAAVLGPRTDWFAPGAVEQLISAQWIVRPDSDRVGVRLHGPALTRRRVEELPSEPTIPGAVQVPPDGRPIVFGPDAPVTGGYPVIAVLTERALDLAAQLRPGDPVRLAYVRTGLRSP
jgi:biotin-dependent carboxylase-like uncharacterized protein